MENNTANIWKWTAVSAIIVIVLLLFLLVKNDSDFENRETEQVADEFINQAEELGDTASQASARLEARTKLMELEVKVAAQQEYEQNMEAVAEIRADLKTAYAEASGDVKKDWEELDTKFEELGDALKNKSANSLAALKDLIVRLELEVKR